ncbi:PRC-barrel domain-containing protein [Candidatus Woesearchaeota archaeon]|nr:PRC-barrel domain-containing protein [Candidatus Woesearchaeota archaeon]
MRFIILIVISLLSLPLIHAESTFFDNPDDVFIMGDSETTGGAVSGGGGCSYKWNCTDWSKCLSSGKQTRICTNLGTCSDSYKIPEIEQSCTYAAPEIEGDKELEKEYPHEDEINDFPEKTPNNWNYLLPLTIILLSCLGCICIFRYRKEIKNFMNRLNRKYDNDSIRGLINKKVYTDEGNCVGKIEEAILQHDKIHSLKIVLNKIPKFVAKGIIIKYRSVKSIGEIVIIDNEMLDNLRKYKT